MTEAVPLADILAARERTTDSVLRTPLVSLELEGAPVEIWLKLENLQPIGSFKIRGAGNAMALASPAGLARGVWTASAGNMAQGVAWQARRLGIPCTVVAPDHAPEAKLAAIRRLGASIVTIPFADWFQILETGRHPGMDGWFVHPVSDGAVMAGNGTIGLEIHDALGEVDAILVPYGGGGLSCGIASAMRGLGVSTRIFACEVETAAPFTAALAAGAPTRISYVPSFVDGIGSPFVLADMWPRASRLLAGSIVVTLEQVAEAIRLLVSRQRVVAEGAGAASLAAALTGHVTGRVVCVISGGNLDAARLARILGGDVPD